MSAEDTVRHFVRVFKEDFSARRFTPRSKSPERGELTFLDTSLRSVLGMTICKMKPWIVLLSKGCDELPLLGVPQADARLNDTRSGRLRGQLPLLEGKTQQFVIHPIQHIGTSFISCPLNYPNHDGAGILLFSDQSFGGGMH